MQKRPTEARYYVCRGRFRNSHLDGSPACTLPYVDASWLEWSVWKKVKAALNNRDSLLQCVEKALADLEDRKGKTGGEAIAVDGKLEDVKGRLERLGIAFADGAIKEELYRLKLGELKKQEAELVKCRQNLDPHALVELGMLDERVNMVREVLKRGKLTLTEFGIFGMVADGMAPLGFNAWRETDSKLAIGEVTEQDIFRVEGTDRVMRGIAAPAGFWQCEDPKEQDETIKSNLRAVLQLFNIRVYVFPGRVEIQGAIPLQMLEIPAKDKPACAPIIRSASP